MERTLAGLAGWPVNVGLQAGARAEDDGSLDALLDAGACGFKIHEDYGAYPELIDHVLRFADAHDVAVSLHTDGLHESAELEDTVAAIAGRTVHAYHVEGSGGGHVPDLLGLVREADILCSSTTPTHPVRGQRGRRAGPDDRAQPRRVVRRGRATSRWSASASTRPRWPPRGRSTSWARSRIVNSDSQGMGRIMETVRRTFQLAHVMARLARDRRPVADHPGLPDEPERRLRFDTSASCATWPRSRSSRRSRTASPTTSGRWRPGRLADIVLWKPGVLRRQARARAQGRVPGLGAARRGQRDGRAGRADPLPAGLGRDAVGRAASLSATFVSARGAADRAASDATGGVRTVRRGRPWDARPDARLALAATEPRHRSRSTRPTAG